MKILKIAAVALVLLLVGCGGTEKSGSQGEPQDGSQAGGQTSEGATSGSKSTTGTTRTTPDASGESKAAGNMTASGLSIVTIDASSGEKVRVRVEVADNPVSRFLGLRGRENLPENRGMLFVYSEEQPMTFTMEDTPTPLSIAFIDSEERIIDIQDMKPLDDEPPGYDSAEPAQYALEVNKGFFEENGVDVGDRVTLPE